MPLKSARTTQNAVAIRWLVHAPVERVWHTLTEPAKLAEWMGELQRGTITEGDTFEIDHGEGYIGTCEVTSILAGSLLAHSWDFPDETISQVAWRLEPHDEGTLLSLTHDDLGEMAGGYCDGWIAHLVYLEATVHEAPLPKSMFWPLHGTLVQLHASA